MTETTRSRNLAVSTVLRGHPCTSAPAAILAIYCGLAGIPRRQTLDIRAVASLARTTSADGTNWKGASRAFEALGMDARLHTGREAAVEALRQGVDAGDYLLCRSGKGSDDGWLAVYARGFREGHIDRGFKCFDPARGRFSATTPEMLVILAAGGFEVARIDRTTAKTVRVCSLASLMGGDAVAADKLTRSAMSGTRGGVLAVRSRADREVSRVVMVDGRPAAVHHMALVAPETATGERIGKRGVESIFLAVDPAYDGMGYDDLLRAVPAFMGADYVASRGMRNDDELYFRHFSEPWLAVPAPNIHHAPLPLQKLVLDAALLKKAADEAAGDSIGAKRWASRVLLPFIATRTRFDGPGKDAYDSVRLIVSWMAEGSISRFRISALDAMALYDRQQEAAADKAPERKLNPIRIRNAAMPAVVGDHSVSGWIRDVLVPYASERTSLGGGSVSDLDFARDLAVWVKENALRDSYGAIWMSVGEAIEGMAADMSRVLPVAEIEDESETAPISAI